ncbi:MAG: glycosyltransferase family 2 protein [Pirellulales bacterium]|nr:glycosyltransferase family 2 protein [Pirellulales bacterium]
MAQCLLSVVLPVFNEAAVLPELVAQVTAALEQTGMNWEVLFINDGSTDDSPRILDELAIAHANNISSLKKRNLPKHNTKSHNSISAPADSTAGQASGGTQTGSGTGVIRVLHLSRNFGHQAAVQAGLAHARGDAVILMDSDLQDEPRAIGTFVQQWRAGYDVVYALRRERKEAWWKRALFDGFHRLLARFATTKIPADAGNFSLMDRRVVRQITQLGESDRYLPGLRAWVGFRQTGVEVERNARYDDTPRVSLRGLVRLAKTAIFSFSSLPLTLFARIGYGATVLFLLLATYALGAKLFTSSALPGWTSHLLVGSFFGALNALGISMLGEYAVRIYDQVRGRPLFLVARETGVEGQSAIESAAQAKVDQSGDSAQLLRQSRKLLKLSIRGKQSTKKPADNRKKTTRTSTK